MKQNIFICSFCKKQSDTIGVIQKEEHYYSLNIVTEQWEDLHGNERVELQSGFCLLCEKNIPSKLFDTLL